MTERPPLETKIEKMPVRRAHRRARLEAEDRHDLVAVEIRSDPLEVFLLRKLADAGFPLREATQGLNTIYCYTIGFAIEEQAVYPRPGKRRKRYELAERAKRVDSKRFPLAARAGEHTFVDFDKHFEQGLRLIIKGLQR